MRALITGVILLYCTPIFAQGDTLQLNTSDMLPCTFHAPDSVVASSTIFLWDEAWIARDSETYVNAAVAIPEGETLDLHDCTLTFGPKGSIICYGDVRIRNCTFLGGDGTCKGLRFMGAHTLVELSVFRGFELDSLAGEGALEFFGSEVQLRDVLLEDIVAASAVHMLDCQVQIERCAVHGCAGNALDFNLCKGQARHLEVREVGEIGIQLSGSAVHLLDINATQCARTGLRLGERSEADGLRWFLDQCALGISVENASVLKLHSAPFFVNCPRAICLQRTDASYTTGGTLRTNGLQLPEQIERDAFSVLE